MLRGPSLQSEIKEISDVDLILVDTCSAWKEMAVDIVEYSDEVQKDLRSFKKHVIGIRDISNQISALHEAVIEIEANVSEYCGLPYEEMCAKVDDVYQNHLENTDNNSAVEGILQSVDNFIEESQLTADENEDNSEICVVSSTESYKDPLTKQLIENPVKSQICGHSYEESTIMSYLQKSKRCPHSGCVSSLTRNDLVEDLEMKRKLRNLSLMHSRKGQSSALDGH